jgi:hypothetical protein
VSAALAGIPERTHHRRLATLRSGDAPVKGPWPTPAVDATEALAAKYAADWPAWGQRKIAAMMRADGHQASTSTCETARAASVGALDMVDCLAATRSW